MKLFLTLNLLLEVGSTLAGWGPFFFPSPRNFAKPLAAFVKLVRLQHLTLGTVKAKLQCQLSLANG